MSSQSQTRTSHAARERFGHLPALSRFYGISPKELMRMPRWLVRLYLEYMEPIRAQEQLAMLQATGFPNLEKAHERRKVVRDLENIADRIVVQPEPEIPDSDEAYMAAVMQTGIPVSVVDADGNPIPVENVNA